MTSKLSSFFSVAKTVGGFTPVDVEGDTAGDDEGFGEPEVRGGTSGGMVGFGTGVGLLDLTIPAFWRAYFCREALPASPVIRGIPVARISPTTMAPTAIMMAFLVKRDLMFTK